MYEFILWTCLTTTPACPVYDSVRHIVEIFSVPNEQACEDAWQESLKIPDPPGTKSYHKCQPVGFDI